uniref:NFU1 iron-sulfur cluster protein n=1 Tax=Xerophyta humilis TaxID=211604 RepID=Q6J9F4_9LILI|nr:unknown [Xerophyta humilis]
MASKIARSVASRLGSTRKMTTATTARMKPVAPTATDFVDQNAKGKVVKGDMFPVYVALGMITLSLGFGAHTAKQHLMHSPGVRVSKKQRDTVLDVDDPDRVASESDRFINKSFFRKVAHIQDFRLHPSWHVGSYTWQYGEQP